MHPHYLPAPLLALLLWLAGLVSASAGENASFSAALESINKAQIQAHVDVLADDTFEGREAGSRGGRAAGNYLAKQLDQLALVPAGESGGYFQQFRGGYRNVLALMAGSDPELSQEVVVLGAHYDHVGYGRASNSYGPTGYIHNGADDNASGTAGLLEAAEAFTKLAVAPRRSVLFAFWDGEENGLLGSQHWVTEPTLGKRKATFMFNLDMIGRLRQNRLEVYGFRTGFGLRKLLARGNQDLLDLDFKWEMKADSDHYSFYAKNIPTLMLHTGLHEDYHRPSDESHKINAEGAQTVSRLVFAAAHDLADRQETTAFRAAARRESKGNKTLLEAPLASPPPRLGISWNKFEASRPGLTVSRVVPASAAEKAGIRVQDTLLALNGRAITDDKQFGAEILAAASPVEILLERAGEKSPLTLRVPLDGSAARVGLGWREDDAEPGTVLLTQVLPNSPAARGGLALRDRIYEVAGEGFGSGVELRDRLARLEGEVEVLAERQGRLFRAVLQLPPQSAAP